jgi:hypothetical protein
MHSRPEWLTETAVQVSVRKFRMLYSGPHSQPCVSSITFVAVLATRIRRWINVFVFLAMCVAIHFSELLVINARTSDYSKRIHDHRERLQFGTPRLGWMCRVKSQLRPRVGHFGGCFSRRDFAVILRVELEKPGLIVISASVPCRCEHPGVAGSVVS